MKPLEPEQKALLERELRDHAEALAADTQQLLEDRPEAGRPPRAREQLGERQLARMLAELQAIEELLARLRRPDYGRCSACGDGIAFSLLRLDPDTRLCALCELPPPHLVQGAHPPALRS